MSAADTEHVCKRYGSAKGKLHTASRHVLVTIVALGVAACQSISPKTDTAITTAQPSQSPVRTQTHFTEALNCMDELMLQHQVPRIILTSGGLPDRTNSVFAGSRDMLINSLSRMSIRSDSLYYIDNDPTLNADLAKSGRPERISYYLRGSISQLDQNVIADGQSAGLQFRIGDTRAGPGIDRSRAVSVITVDMSMAHADSRRIIARTSTSNSLAFQTVQTGGDISARLGAFGLFFDMRLSEQEGTHAALRTLIELTALETIGRFYGLPYWQCAGVKQSDPKALKAARDQYDQLNDSQRQRFVAQALQQTGYLSTRTDNTIESIQDAAELRAALAQYQQDHDLASVGLVNFESFYRLLNDARIGASLLDHVAQTDSTPQSSQVTQGRHKRQPTPQDQVVNTQVAAARRSDASPEPLLSINPPKRLGGVMTAQVSLTGAGYLACFYQDGDGNVARVYPSLNQTQAYLTRGTVVAIPGASDEFRITATHAGAEEHLACLASPQPVLDALPDELAVPVLSPLPIPSIAALKASLRSELATGIAMELKSYTTPNR